MDEDDDEDEDEDDDDDDDVMMMMMMMMMQGRIPAPPQSCRKSRGYLRTANSLP